MKFLKALFGKPTPIAKAISNVLATEKPKKVPAKSEPKPKAMKFEYAGSLLDSDAKGSFIEPEGSYDLDIVGEASYQSELEAVSGIRTEKGAQFECEALLLCENENKYDKNAVCVKIQNKTVGYLSTADAKEWRKMLDHENSKEEQVRVKALIVGGWLANEKKGISPGHFGVKLDVPVDSD